TWRAALHADPEAPPLAEQPFLVEDFEPERLAFDPLLEAAAIDPAAPGDVQLEARFLFGAPAAGLEVEAEVRLEPTNQLDAYPGYRFGLADEEANTVGTTLPPTRTDAAGLASLALDLPSHPGGSQPQVAKVAVRVLEGGGRPVERTLERPVRDSRPRLGIKPLFEGAVDEGGTAAFEVIALDPQGNPLAVEGLRWTLSRVTTSFQWYQYDGRWDYEPVTRRERVASGELNLGADAPGRIQTPVDWGGYELMVSAPVADAGAGPGRLGGRAGAPAAIPASLTFEAGWYLAPKAIDTPDLLKVSLDQPAYRVGEKVRAHLEARFPGTALVLALGDRLLSVQEVQVPAGGTTVEIPVSADWGAGAYVTALLYRPMDLVAKRMPGRAIGLAWAAVNPGDRQLRVTVTPIGPVAPRQPLDLELSVPDLPPGAEAYVTLAAVDIGILNLTRFAPPDPDAWYFGQRRLGMEIRDLYGQLIDRMHGAPGVVRSGGDGGLVRLEGPPPTEDLLAFHSGILRLDAQGKARVRFSPSDFNGTIQLMAMAWTATGVGQASQDLVMRDPIVIQASLPRFLAPGDESRALLELTHVAGPAGRVAVSLEAGLDQPIGGAETGGSRESRVEGRQLDRQPIEVLAQAAHQERELISGGRARIEVPLLALASGDAILRARLRTPDGQEIVKRLRLPVRDNRPVQRLTQVETLKPGGPGLVLSPTLFQDLQPDSAALLVSASGAGRLDLPGLLLSLDRYPYGCAEQLASRALPLLYINEIALAAGLSDRLTGGLGGDPGGSQGGGAGTGPRIQAAITDLIGKQGAEGGFGLWGPGGDDFWLDAYVTDFLTRAREAGHAVPEVAFQLALDNLRNRLAYAGDFGGGDASAGAAGDGEGDAAGADEGADADASEGGFITGLPAPAGPRAGGEDVAYALYVLARNARAVIGDLRYYAEVKLQAFATPLARAQLGAALALYGDRPRAERAFASALARLNRGESGAGWRTDYGSDLRDAAAILALAAETGTQAVDLNALAKRIDQLGALDGRLSTQEQAWLLVAAQALMQGAAKPRLVLDGQPTEGPFFKRFAAGDLASAPATLVNRGQQPLEVLLTLAGIPRQAPPAGGQGYRVERAWYDPEGRRVQPDHLTQGQRLVVILTVTAEAPGAARLLVDDPLPAGLEIENPSLLRAADLQGIPWLGLLEGSAHQEFRADRFVAAVDRQTSDPAQFQLAYRVRAVTPGRFLQPAATVEDMYRPRQRGWTGEGRVEVLPGQ
ncbi:MAG TPA: alpha-2-macroglobulin, partial [Chromatiaceae bacterium]|nr:alpha-2-macroglobulin [Chromatiaceae bacterium]